MDLITIGVAIAYVIAALTQNLGMTKETALPPSIIGNGKAILPNTKAVVKEDFKEAEIVQFLSANGKLDVPGAGKKSLRKKKSKRNINGGS